MITLKRASVFEEYILKWCRQPCNDNTNDRSRRDTGGNSNTFCILLLGIIQSFCNLTNVFYTYLINCFPMIILLFYCLIYSVFIVYVTSLNKFLIKIDTDIKSPIKSPTQPRKLKHQKEKHKYIPTIRRKERYK